MHIHPFGLEAKDGQTMIDEKDVHVFKVIDEEKTNDPNTLTVSEANLLLGYKHVMPYDDAKEKAAAEQKLAALLATMKANQANADMIAGITRKPGPKIPDKK